MHRGVVTPVIDFAALAGVGEARTLWSSRVIVLNCASSGQSRRLGILFDRSHAEQVPDLQMDQAITAAVQIWPWGKTLIDEHGTYCQLDLHSLLSPQRQGVTLSNDGLMIGESVMDSLKPDTEPFRQLTELLRERIGLNPASVGKQTLEHAVEHRLKALKIKSAIDYVSRLAHDGAEWSEFLEEIIVPESWFFRELTPFRCVRDFLRAVMSRENRPKTLRFLSIPCSRGEEPYSLAMTLLDAGLLPVQFEIVACDLSERSIEFARRGRYRSIAFRETDPVCQRLTRQHFQPTGEEWELNPDIRSKVKFQQANLAAPDSLGRLGRFDFIFCRNVLIYLTEDVRQRTLAAFKRMLLPGGLLYLGHSECRLGPQAGAVVWNTQFPAAFTWSQTTTPSPATLSRENASPSARQISTQASTAKPALNLSVATPARKSAAAMPSSVSVVPASVLGTNYLPRAKELANRGRLEEAESLCQVMLQNQSPCADVYCLLGVIVQARGDLLQAETHYQKALFLAPDHFESLTHLLLLAQLRGDSKNVGNYQRRLERLRPQGT